MPSPRPFPETWRAGAPRWLGYRGTQFAAWLLRVLQTMRRPGSPAHTLTPRAGGAPETAVRPPDAPDPHLYSVEYATRFPLHFAAHDLGLRYLFDFTVATMSLGLRPGARVMDFAAGPAYVSELLNRLGYDTVAVDWDRHFLALARQRLRMDARCDASRSTFTAGDGTRLPFRDASFDGIVCMNALHHMPDYRATLAEMFRVLRPGARAVFSEPGSQHSRAPESVAAMREQGVLERDILVDELSDLSAEVGFQRMAFKPFLYPDMVDLDYHELRRFGRGKRVANPLLSPAALATYIEHAHALFYLEKPGTPPATSATAAPRLLRARLTVQGCAQRASRTTPLRVRAECENVGECIWLAHRRPVGGFVTFGMKILAPNGRLLDDRRGRTFLPHDVPPGGRVQIDAEADLAGLTPGHYQLLFDMVNEHVCWFAAAGSEPVVRRLEVA